MTAPISELEIFFSTTFEEYSQTSAGSDEPPAVFYRAKQYSLPVDLVPHVYGVFLVVNIPPVAMKKPIHTNPQSHSSNLRGPSAESMQDAHGHKEMQALYNGYVTPSVLNSYYNIDDNTGSTAVEQYVFAALGQTLSPIDLTAFQNTFNLPQQPIAGSIGKFCA